MRREVSISIFAVLILAAAILTVYYLNIGPTGFAVFEQNTKSAFDEGTYNNVVYDANTSTVVLAENQTAGTYTSKIFDGGSGATWNSLVSQGSGVDLQVRVCSSVDCSDANFTTASDLNNLSLSARYFQYRGSFDSVNDSLESVSVDYTAAPVATGISITEPSGEKSSPTGIPLTFTATGTNISCWYNVLIPNGNEIIGNTTITDCQSTSFDLSSEGDYTANVFVNGSAGFVSASSSFSVVEQVQEETTTPVEEEIVTEPPQNLPELTLQTVETSPINPSSSRELSLVVQNTGDFSVSQCNLRSITGDFASWLSFSDASVNASLNPGEESSFAFSVAVPEDASEGQYTFFLNLKCAGFQKNSEFSVQVEKQKLDFEITNVQRTDQNEVSVDYSLTELAGQDQSVNILFTILDASNLDVGNSSENISISANAKDDFRATIPINESIEGNLTLSAAFNSGIYSSSVLEPITLGAPIGGFAIFGGQGGAGSIIIFVVVVIVLVIVFFVARKMRQSGKTLGDLFSFGSGSDSDK